jgi:hypothetical protein
MLVTLKRAAFAVGVAATVVAVGASSSSAATWTATIGGVATGSGAYTAASTTSLKLTDTTTNITVTCTTGTAKGTVPQLGHNVSPTPIATITGTTWTSCTGAGLTFAVTQVGTWNLNATSYTSPTTKGNLTGISAKLSATGCTFNVTGATDGSYTNGTQILSVAPVAGSGHTLSISGVSGCFGVVANGHTASFSGSYKVSATSPNTGALVISSP